MKLAKIIGQWLTLAAMAIFMAWGCMGMLQDAANHKEAERFEQLRRQCVYDRGVPKDVLRDGKVWAVRCEK